MYVSGVSSLEEALWNMFVEEELFEGSNLYRCAQCDRLVTAAKVSASFQTVTAVKIIIAFTFVTFLSYSVGQVEEAPSIHDYVFTEIQL